MNGGDSGCGGVIIIKENIYITRAETLRDPPGGRALDLVKNNTSFEDEIAAA